MIDKPEQYAHYAALIFDMDGTLIDSGQLHEQAWSRALADFNIPIDRDLMRSLAGVPTVQTVQRLLGHFSLETKIDVMLVANRKAQYAEQLAPKYLKATALSALVTHYAGKLPMALGTGAHSAEAKSVLALCQLDKYFPVIVGADRVEQHKPAPDTFLLCAAELGVNAEHCVVFEDSALGLQAGRSAGMHVVDVAATHHIHNDYFLTR